MLLACFFTAASINAQGLQSEVDLGLDKIQSLERAISLLDEEHCEVPCGIYGDSLRLSLLEEHAKTVEKGMAQISELSKADQPNYNQIVRWVMNKEKHAEEIQQIVSQYFLHQRIKMPADDAKRKAVDDYHDKLEALHAIQVYAMKCKQGTDSAMVEKLQVAIHDFGHLYFGDHH